MANITAADVKRLRDMTQAGMMECKKALTETEGDFEAAVDLLRPKGAAKAAAMGTSPSASERVNPAGACCHRGCSSGVRGRSQRATSGAPSQTRRAAVATSSARRSSATTRESSPFCSASAAARMRPSSRISSSTAGPARRSRPAISPGYIEKPTRLIGAPNFADSPAMRRSHWPAISSPPPMHGPRIRAMVGCGQLPIAASARPTVA